MTCPSRHNIEEEILNVIRPTKIQKNILKKIYYNIRSILELCLHENKLRAEILPVGSFAKDTLTRDKWELDIFILFEDMSDKWIRENAEEFLRSCLKRKIPFTVKYAQHPYVTAILMGVEADIVPAIRLEKPRKKGLGVERTPFHTRYVISKLDHCMKDDVRLLKAFLKGLGIYGAETRVQGFSGYLSELLIITYKSFDNLIREARGWRPPVYIDPEGIGDKEYLLSKYRNSPLIVVDPVDPERNAAGAVSRKSLATFILASKLYYSKPRKEYFYPFAKRSELVAPIYVISINCRGNYQDDPPESIWGRIRRAAHSLFRLLRSKGFDATFYSYETDEYREIQIEIGLTSLYVPSFEIIEGPEAWSEDQRVLRFIEKRNKNKEIYWINDEGRLTWLKPRKHTHAISLIDKWIEENGKRVLKTNICSVKYYTCTISSRSNSCRPVMEWMSL